LAGLVCGTAGAAEIVESARSIPVTREVDVVVVGGSCGAVAAARAAAEAGVKVFLAAPRTYLGDDVAGTLRLWLEPDETPVSPLARALFVQTNAAVAFAYKTSIPAGGRHEDPQGDALCDGRYREVTSQSVEYADDVTVTLELAKEQEVASVELWAFERGRDFAVGGATVSLSVDGKTWTAPVAGEPSRRSGATDEPVSFLMPLDGSRAAQLRVTVAKKPGAKRMLLGEIVVRRVLPAGGEIRTPTPLHVKQTLDRALLDAGVASLTGTYATDLLRDAAGRPSGIVMANRNGRQAVTAKVIVDATERATVARLAGAAFTPYPAGPQTFTRVVVAGDAPKAEGMTVRRLPGDYDAPVTIGPRKTLGSVAGKAYECTLSIDMKDGSFRSFAEAEQIARDRTFVKSLLDEADTLFQVPPDRLVKGVPRVHVLGGCAGHSLRPLALMDEGTRIGAAAAAEAKGADRREPFIVHRGATDEARKPTALEVREALNGLRPFQTPAATVPSAARALPVLGEYDVVVVGGGTCGAPAGIAAARQGAKTLVIEQLHGMGGVATLGMIGVYCFGNICGFTSEIDRGVKALGAEVNIVGKREWFRRENRRCGAEIWFGSLACGALTDGGRVVGVVVATPAGRGAVLAKRVVDATGNSDVAAAAGAPCVFVGPEEIAVQGVGLSPRQLGASYINSDFGYVNDCDPADLWLFGVRGRARVGATAWDASQLVQSRERRRIEGDAFLTPLDILNKRTYPDTVVIACSNFDSHGYTVADVCYVAGPDTPSVHRANIPYRAMLPQGVENVIVAGLGISAHRDAFPIIRMQPDVQNMGYVAGVAAAAAAREDKTFRTLDVKALQRHLVDAGVIPEEVLSWRDSHTVNPETLALAVKNAGDDYKEVYKVLDHADAALPMLRAAYASARTPAQRLCYAHILGILGDAAGVETLAEAVKNTPQESTIKFHWSERFGRRVTDLDSYVVALGRTRDKRALAPILELVNAMDARSPNSGFRAVTLALEALGDHAAAQPLAELLRKPGIAGHAMPDVGGISAYGYGNGTERSLALRELALARALYRLGDHEGVAEQVLRQYTHDLRGIYAQHAAAVLQAGKK
jgi:flavin-dependent dehydrogenase